MRGKAFAAHV